MSCLFNYASRMYAIVFKNIRHEELPLDFKSEDLVHFFKVATRVLMINVLFEILRYTNKRNHSEAVIFLIDHILLAEISA